MPLKLTEAGLCVGMLQMVMAHSNPVIEALECEMQIVICLQLDHRQPPVSSNAEQVEHPAVFRAGNRRYLRIHMVRIEPRNDPRLIPSISFACCSGLVSTIAYGVRIGIVRKCLLSPREIRRRNLRCQVPCQRSEIAP